MCASWAVAVLTLALAASGFAQGFPISIVPATAHAGSPVVEVTLRLSPAIDGSIETARLVRARADAAWQLEDRSVRVAVAGQLSASGRPGVETLLLIRSADHEGYVLHGPLRWPMRPEIIAATVEWRRTVRGRLPEDAASAPSWIDARADRSRHPWPLCNLVGRVEWECIGVPLDTPGVATTTVAGGVAYGVAPASTMAAGVEIVGTAVVRWGRLLVIDTIAAPFDVDSVKSGGLRVAPLRIATSRARPRSVRLNVEVDDRVRIEKVGGRVYWASGMLAPDAGWLEIGGPGVAPARLEIVEVASVPPELPLRVALQPAAVIVGTITRMPGVRIPGAIVTLFRFAGPHREDEPDARRIIVSETTTDQEGMFRFDGLAVERYEIVAVHPGHGRADRRLVPDDQEIEIRLNPPSRAVGRVVRGGTALRGIRVTIVPTLAEYANSTDLTELGGGETTTDREGRFVLAVPPRGSGEIRIGDERSGVRRIPLPAARAGSTVIDLGTISLDSPPATTFVLEGSDGCELLLTGPAGRAGLTMVRPVRVGPAMFEAAVPEPGMWLVVAVCGRTERAVVPSTVAIGAGTREQAIRLIWAQ